MVQWSASSFHRVLAASQRLREVVFVLNVKLARLAGSVAQLICVILPLNADTSELPSTLLSLGTLISHCMALLMLTKRRGQVLTSFRSLHNLMACSTSINSATYTSD